MSRSMPICEALAADPDRYMFKAMLRDLLTATTYEEKRTEALYLHGYLNCAAETNLLTHEQYRQLWNEIHGYVWGPLV